MKNYPIRFPAPSDYFPLKGWSHFKSRKGRGGQSKFGDATSAPHTTAAVTGRSRPRLRGGGSWENTPLSSLLSSPQSHPTAPWMPFPAQFHRADGEAEPCGERASHRAPGGTRHGPPPTTAPALGATLWGTPAGRRLGGKARRGSRCPPRPAPLRAPRPAEPHVPAGFTCPPAAAALAAARPARPRPHPARRRPARPQRAAPAAPCLGAATPPTAGTDPAGLGPQGQGTEGGRPLSTEPLGALRGLSRVAVGKMWMSWVCPDNERLWGQQEGLQGREFGGIGNGAREELEGMMRR